MSLTGLTDFTLLSASLLRLQPQLIEVALAFGAAKLQAR